MFKIFNSAISDLYDSFSNGSKGFSAKKLTAFSITVAYCYSHKFVDTSNIVAVLGVDGGIITLLFGVNVLDKKYKNSTESEELSNQ